MGVRPRIKRLVLKVSGEVFGSDGIDAGRGGNFADELVSAAGRGVQTAVVPGGGNILRGGTASGELGDRVSLDHMGMLATIINALALRNLLEIRGTGSVVTSPFGLEPVAERYSPRNAIAHLEAGKIVIMAGGTGNPFFTTDTAAALRAAEIGADALLKATKVDGVYDRDPMGGEEAKRYTSLTFTDVLKEQLGIIDAAAAALCRDNGIPLIVFNILEPGNLHKVIDGEETGTIVN